MSDINFKELSYLREGNKVQQRIAEVLEQGLVMDKLRKFDPVLIGTFPIDIAVEGSDLDIACCYQNKEEFIQTVQLSFSFIEDYTLTEAEIGGIPTVVVNFTLEEFPVELFAQPRPIEEQNGYRHMLIEYAILNEKGDSFKQEVIKLKKAGIKTEPAFAQLLGLTGNPYDSLLVYGNKELDRYE
ncbi:DUF4269 domain-containing protein [Myroides profundi]|uniref:DUF4269 domain-containing protein n=1 Tax=Myroides profundi TaxID=480520 RepID=A0AAJ5BEW9_MYRPR|nr:DUF4269 domain-containing protein [Myroides profundi]AJH15776.1 hypothetical protein MPR_2610 [Myroides profundi]SER32349.1 protein of unknown function [Myroides profundi]